MTDDASCPARGMGVEILLNNLYLLAPPSCPARGMGVEISEGLRGMISEINVMPREGHGSRNFAIPVFELGPA